MLTTLLLTAAAAQFQPAASLPLLDGNTAKSTAQFEQCFTSSQQRQSRPMWLVPHEDGVRISNEGTSGVANPYRIRFTEAAGGNRVQVLIASRDEQAEAPLVDAVKNCW